MPRLPIIKNRKSGYLSNVPTKVITYLRNTGKFDANGRVEYDEAMDAINRNIANTLPKTTKRRSPLAVNLYQNDNDLFKTISMPKDQQILYLNPSQNQKDIFFEDLLSHTLYAGNDNELRIRSSLSKDILKKHWEMTDKQIRDMAHAQSLKRDVKNAIRGQKYEDESRQKELLNPNTPMISVNHRGFQVGMLNPSQNLMNYLKRTGAMNSKHEVSRADYDEAVKLEREGKLTNESALVLIKTNKKKTGNIPKSKRSLRIDNEVVKMTDDESIEFNPKPLFANNKPLKTNKQIFDILPDNYEFGYVKTKYCYGPKKDKIRYMLSNVSITNPDDDEDNGLMLLGDISPLTYKKMIDKNEFRVMDGTPFLLFDKLPENVKNSMTGLNKPKTPKATTITKMPEYTSEDYMPHHQILSQGAVVALQLTPSQYKKVRYGDRFRIKPAQINNPQANFKFPNMGKHNRDALAQALYDGKTAQIRIMKHEIEGSGIKEFFRGVGKFFKDNWKTIKPIVSTVLDVATPALAKSFPEFAPAIIGTRQLIKSTTGTGVGGSFKSRGVSGGKLVKGSQAAKDHMAKLRAMRGTGLGTKVSVMGGDDEFDGGSFMSR